MAFGSIVFTTRGKVLQSKAQTGTKLNFTKLAIGDGELGSQSVLELTDLKNKKLDIPISSLKVLTGGLASVGGTFTNEDVESGFYWRELGLYAIDPDVGEILYCYGNAGALAEYIPSSGGSEILEKFVAIETIIGNAENVSAIINQSLVYATIEDIESHNSDPKAHSDIRVLIENINVQGDVEEVVNRRLNPDISKPLGTLISEWINTAKTAILNGINGLPQKSIWTDARGAKLDNLDQRMTTTQTNINNNTNAARDNIKNHITTELNARAAKVFIPSNNVRHTVTIKPVFYGNNSGNYTPVYALGRIYFPPKSKIRVKLNQYTVTAGSSSGRDFYAKTGIYAYASYDRTYYAQGTQVDASTSQMWCLKDFPANKGVVGTNANAVTNAQSFDIDLSVFTSYYGDKSVSFDSGYLTLLVSTYTAYIHSCTNLVVQICYDEVNG